MSHTAHELITVRHEAMATLFSITLSHIDKRYARQAAAEALQELDRLDHLLSRFVDHSDVARIGRTISGKTLAIDADTFDCLQIALQVERDTRGAFNIAYRHRPKHSAAALLRLSDTPPTVSVTDNRVTLDLGGIGKGFALDRMAARLFDWDLPHFLLRASASTFLAGSPAPGTPGWRVRLGPPASHHRLCLCHAALSGSGTAVQGQHIVKPHSGEPAMQFDMAWAGAPSAAEADALSTALMVMVEHEIETLCDRRPDCLAYVLPHGQEDVHPIRAATNAVFR